MAQPLITNFYNKRKRRAENVTTKSKVLVLDGLSSAGAKESFSQTVESSEEVKHVLYNYKKEVSVHDLEKAQNGINKHDIEVQLSSKPEIKKNIKVQKSKVPPPTKKMDIRLAFKPKPLNEVTSPNTQTNQFISPRLKKEPGELEDNGNTAKSTDSEKIVVFELLGSLSPQKKNIQSSIKNEKQEENDLVVKEARNELGLKTPKKAVEQKSKEMSLFEIRSKLAGSSRISEIRESIKNFKKAEEQLKEIEMRKNKLKASSPQLRKFTTIDLEVPVSPRKQVSSSPMKASPIKSPLKSPLKVPAYQRFSHLIQPGKQSLPLPYTYRMLGEIFRCTDTVASMFYNRKETVTFPKLKSGVQEMLRRNFTELHLRQIKHVMPNAFKFSQQKLGSIIGVAKNKYELVILPNIDTNQCDAVEDINRESHPLLTPSMLVQRREVFHRNLLEIVKDYHDEFLRNLDPPVNVLRSQLARWHPEFELEKVPLVKPDDLPQPPSEDKLVTAKDVLDRAKSLFGCNQRMEKALHEVRERMKKDEIEQSNSQNTLVNKEPSNLLKGVPKAILDKIRAKQAAKAIVAMSRTPAEDREAMQILRLPEIARIVKNVFVAEKKTVLSLEVVLTKLSDSYREKLSSDELDQHIRLIMKLVPGWLQILYVRKTDYLKISKDIDVSAVMQKLEALAAEKNSDL